MKVVDLAVIGAGLSGCALLAALRRRGWKGSILVLEAVVDQGDAEPRDDVGMTTAGVWIMVLPR